MNTDSSKSVPKKRGRKPGSKNKKKIDNPSPVEKVKKKRGRKPKNNITVNPNPVFNGEECDYIVQLKNIEAPIKELSSYNPNEYFNIKESTLTDNKSKLCWNCCSNINIKHSLPLKYINNVFYIYGNFCSKECSARYCFDNFRDNSNEIYSLINLYNYKETGELIAIKPADSKYVLDYFGGPLSIDQYRSNFKNNNYCNVNRTPIIYLDNSYNIVDHTTSKQYNINNYKIFRKEPINNNNNISNIMKLKIN